LTIFINRFVGSRIVRNNDRAVLEVYVPVAHGSQWQKFSIFVDDSLLDLAGQCFTGWAFAECEEVGDYEGKKTISIEEVPDEIRREFQACNE